jgi:hypothetical protein
VDDLHPSCEVSVVRCSRPRYPTSAIAEHSPDSGCYQVDVRRVVRFLYDLASTQLGLQTGRTFIVTGANGGIGFEAARALSRVAPTSCWRCAIGPPELLDVYASAKDPATAARLWELTEQVVGRPLPV